MSDTSEGDLVIVDVHEISEPEDSPRMRDDDDNDDDDSDDEDGVAAAPPPKQLSDRVAGVVEDSSSASLDPEKVVPKVLDLDENTPRAVQIVSIEGTEGNYQFKFHKESLDKILARIPSDYYVSVVSVVGAFRTGKSFLLSWFLRYLSHLNTQQNKDPTGKAKQVVVADEEPWYNQFSSLGNDGFEWKAGSERNTTGIWMWSHAHLSSTNNDNDVETENKMKIATLLVDTQGMFDHETTMNLTASIFGFSTLLSSFQIYNVDKRIQEDHLQQLALFSEYARTAVGVDTNSTTTAASAAAAAPFQHVEFLIRDWQHFEVNEDDEEALDQVDYQALEQSMTLYLEQVLQERQATDLQETREQITTCFEKITCYGLCHPGFAATKKKYTGDVKALEPLFLRLLDRYCRHVFSEANQQAKKIHGRALTVPELASFVQAYADLFASPEHKFPTAATLLAATTQANNTNAVQLALSDYYKNMDRLVGPKCSSYLKQEEFEEAHVRTLQRSLEHFSSVATFGSKRSIEEARESLEKKLSDRYEIYRSLNEGRNPLAGYETFVIPVAVGIMTFVTQWILDSVCTGAHVCRATSDVLGHSYAVVFSFLAIIAATKAQHLSSFVQTLVAFFTAFTSGGGGGRGSSSGAKYKSA